MQLFFFLAITAQNLNLFIFVDAFWLKNFYEGYSAENA